MSTSKAEIEARKAAEDVANSAAADKTKGQTKQVIGKIKETVGNFIGDDELAAKGTIQRADGKKDELRGEIKEKIENVKDTLKAGADLIKEKLHDVTSKH